MCQSVCPTVRPSVCLALCLYRCIHTLHPPFQGLSPTVLEFMTGEGGGREGEQQPFVKQFANEGSVGSISYIADIPLPFVNNGQMDLAYYYRD